MIRVRFVPLDGGGFRREVRVPSRDEPWVAEVTIPPDLYPGKTSPATRDLHEREPAALRDLGRRIADLALGAEGLAALEELRRGRDPIRITFEESTDSAAASAVPWELMHDGEEYLAAHPRIHLVRAEADREPIGEVTTRRPLRVLILWASPRDQPSVDVEWEQIRLSLALGPYLTQGLVEVHEILHATRPLLDEALESGAFDLVYYTGHGTHREGVGYLCLEDGDGGTDLLSATHFARKLAFQERPPSLVFLNCCLSGAVDRRDPAMPGRFLDVGRRLLREGVPFVVATLTPVFVSSARSFMEGLLGTLLRGPRFDVERAMAAARTAVLEDPTLDRDEAQTFFQYLLLTATGEGWGHGWAEEEGKRERVEPDLDRILYGSDEYPAPDPSRVRRNQLLVAVESAWRDRARAVGLYGIGGIGKTVTSAQVLERAVSHVSSALRADRAVWLDLRQEDDLHGSLVAQLCSVLDQGGAAGAAEALRQSPDPEPVEVARTLSRALGARGVLVLDNCETLLDREGRPLDGPARDLVTALVRHAGWRTLLTSRESFSLARDGRDPQPIHWLHVGELKPTERGALLRAALAASNLGLERFSPQTQRRIFDEVAGHPYELRLFFGEPRVRSDPEGLIEEVHHRTGRYARLEYYVGRVPQEVLPVLWLVAALDEPVDGPLLWALWARAAEALEWHREDGLLRRALAELAGRGLLEERDGLFSVQPVLASFLEAEGGACSLPAAARQPLHRVIARACLALSNAVDEMARELHRTQELPEEELHRRLVGLSGHRLTLLHRAFRHSRRQGEIRLHFHLLQELATNAAGRLPRSLLAAYAADAENLLDRIVAESDRQAPSEDVVLGFGVLATVYLRLRGWNSALAAFDKGIDLSRTSERFDLLGRFHHSKGRVHEEQRDWESALSSYGEAIEWKQKTGQLHEVGSTYHQIGIVHAEQRDWESALSSYGESIEWKQKTGQLHAIGMSYHQIGRVHEERGHPGEAGAEFLRALESYALDGFLQPSHVVITLGSLRRVLAAEDPDAGEPLSAGDRAELGRALDALLQEHPVLAGAQATLDAAAEEAAADGAEGPPSTPD